jgi:glycosyltransferase involved in cell wall biosynthesis
MKIAVWHNLPSGGGKRALYYHVRGLVERGHEVACWSLDTADHSYLPLSEFAPERIVPANVPADLKARAGSVTAWLAPWYSAAVARMQAFDEACQRCATEIRAGQFDLLFANGSIGYHVPFIMKHVAMKKVLYLQEPSRFLYEARPVLPWVASAPDDPKASLFGPRKLLRDYPNLQTLRLQAKQEWLNVEACDRVLVNSYFSRESVLQAYGVESRVCYLGVDTTLFRNLDLARERFIVGLGSLDPIKRVDLAIRAVALLPEPRPPLVWIANSGSENYRDTITEVARSLGVTLRVHMAISDSELVAILNRAAVMLCTSRLEPFGFAALEANACGLPVVGVAEGGIRETIKDGVNGFLVEPDAEAVARAVDQLLLHPSLAKRMGAAGIANVRDNWDVERSVDRLETNLREVVAKVDEPGSPLT